MKILALIFSLILTTKSCTKKEDINSIIPIVTKSTQKMYFNGKIFTVNDKQPWAEAIIVDKNKIVFVGSNIEADKRVEAAADKIDLKGKVVLPGFHDVHMHPMEVGSTTTTFVLKENETNAENYITTIKKAANDNPNVAWIIGFGHSINTLLEAQRNPLEIIDEAVSNRPVIIMEQTSHSMWLNSKALELAGISITTPNPQGGIIMKNNGKLNGILIDNAGDVVFQQAISALNDSNGEYNGMVEYVLPELAKYGITSVSDARTYWKRDQHKTWKNLADNNKLTARFNLGLWAYPTADDVSQISALKALFFNDENSLLKINQIKLYSDGITHNTTAALLSNYHEDYFNEPTNNGLNYFTETRIATYIKELESVGFDFHIHAIGNRGVTESLNAIEQSGTSKGRHRLTHVEMVTSTDMNRFKQLNVTADAQVTGEFTQPQYWHDNDHLLGSDLAENQVPIKSLKDAGARLTLSSDWNVSTLNPFVGIQNAITRIPQNILLEEAIKAYTINGAYVMRQEDKVGSLEVGKLADFIVLDNDIFTIPSNQINKTKVILTIFNGKEI
ncbi:amidohydrolase [Tenacibaculum ovolyticum]|uniref:amidohydrolase n=1 Tax=Tenacibaculum ovolyticum TaxID=104270 RepID=UPI0022F40503|nr:amidohydrolase [Tenacibaculum ovolyticum]WBX76664.1 amidohydrolase [Tenacibaculum ovolyticum]